MRSLVAVGAVAVGGTRQRYSAANSHSSLWPPVGTSYANKSVTPDPSHTNAAILLALAPTPTTTATGASVHPAKATLHTPYSTNAHTANNGHAGYAVNGALLNVVNGVNGMNGEMDDTGALKRINRPQTTPGRLRFADEPFLDEDDMAACNPLDSLLHTHGLLPIPPTSDVQPGILLPNPTH